MTYQDLCQVLNTCRSLSKDGNICILDLIFEILNKGRRAWVREERVVQCSRRSSGDCWRDSNPSRPSLTPPDRDRICQIIEYLAISCNSILLFRSSKVVEWNRWRCWLRCYHYDIGEHLFFNNCSVSSNYSPENGHLPCPYRFAASNDDWVDLHPKSLLG